MSSPEIIVVGGGIMGCSTALRLARAGASVCVLERSVPGAEASTAAAGILAPMMENEQDGPGLRLGLRSATLHSTWAADLRERHALEVGHRVSGLLRVAFAHEGDASVMALEEHAARLRASGLTGMDGVALLDGAEARRREPALSPAVCAALELPGEGQVDPRLLLPALSVAAEREGVRFLTDCVVREVLVHGGRAQGVRLDDGPLHAGHVVVAAGSWTSVVPGVPVPAGTVAPVKGQLMRTHARPRLLERVVFGAGGYLVPRAAGDVLIGATTEHVGFARGVTLSGLAELIAIATTVAPRLAGCVVQDHWAGFRPGTPDGLPLVGSTHVPGLWLASGHYRNGILLAPVTAEILTAQLLGVTSPDLSDLDDAIRALDPRRFASPSPTSSTA
ncbi:MAG: glycine oxidase ThiO [Polyangiales bacterium]